MSNSITHSLWIGAPEEAAHNRPPIEVLYYRKTFHVDEKNCSLAVLVGASTRYKLFMNGQLVINGPCRGDKNTLYYDSVELTDFLVPGENVIAVKVVAYPPREAATSSCKGPTWAMTNAAGACLLVEGCVKNAAGQPLEDVSTGCSTWLTHIDRATSWELSPITHWLGSMEVVDGAKLPHGWTEAGTPEGDWREARVRFAAISNAATYGIFAELPLLPRPIPYMFLSEGSFIGSMPLKQSDAPEIHFKNGQATLAPGTKYAIELNAGAITCGYFRMRVAGGQGAKLTIRYAECYGAENPSRNYLVKGLRDDWQNFFIIGHEDVYYPSGRDECYEPFWLRTFRFIRLEAEVSDTALTLYEPSYIETGYPLEEKSSIHSDQPWVSELWDISARTLKLCMFETYMDCPYYEQLQYSMDTRLEILFTYMLSGDTRLAKRALHDFYSSMLPFGLTQARYPSEEPQIIPGFSIYWISMVEDYYWQTGDLSVIAQYRSAMDTILEWFHGKVGACGLIEKLGYWEFADWVEEWEHLQGVPAAVTHGPSTIHNLLYVYGLQAAARMNRLTGRTDIAAEYEQKAEQIKRRVEELCWSAESGMYRDGPDFEEYTQHAQIWSVLTGLAAGDKAEQVMTNALSVSGVLQCTFVMQFYLFRALEEAGLYAATEKQWDLWKHLLTLHLTTVPEAPTQARSDCHAWGALPLFEFTRKLLGVNPLSPGWEGILIEPKCLYIHSAKGEVVTPKGQVMVTVSQHDHRLTVSGHSPAGVPLVVKMPDGSEHTWSAGGDYSMSCPI